MKLNQSNQALRHAAIATEQLWPHEVVLNAEGMHLKDLFNLLVLLGKFNLLVLLGKVVAVEKTFVDVVLSVPRHKYMFPKFTLTTRPSN